MTQKNGVLQQNTRRNLVHHAITPQTDEVNAINLENDKWIFDDLRLQKQCGRRPCPAISITDELYLEALECCDVVQLPLRDVIESFEEHYEQRLQEYMKRALNVDRRATRRGSVLAGLSPDAADDEQPESPGPFQHSIRTKFFKSTSGLADAIMTDSKQLRALKGAKSVRDVTETGLSSKLQRGITKSRTMPSMTRMASRMGSRKETLLNKMVATPNIVSQNLQDVLYVFFIESCW